jgi:hypothetical protein
MYSLISFQANGERIEAVNQVPAFYGLVRNGKVLDLFTSLEALHLAKSALEAIECAEASTGLIEFNEAA